MAYFSNLFHSAKYSSANICPFSYPSRHYLFSVNNENTGTIVWNFFKIPIKTPERRQWCRSDVFIVNIEQISHIVLVFSLLTLNKQVDLIDTFYVAVFLVINLLVGILMYYTNSTLRKMKCKLRFIYFRNSHLSVPYIREKHIFSNYMHFFTLSHFIFIML